MENGSVSRYFTAIRVGEVSLMQQGCDHECAPVDRWQQGCDHECALWIGEQVNDRLFKVNCINNLADQ